MGYARSSVKTGRGDPYLRVPLFEELAIIEDPLIFRAAAFFIMQHGGDAPVQAEARAETLRKEGDTDGAAIWVRIARTIDEMLSEPEHGEKPN